jgi:hydrogenase nickel incorporation protein HypA/HybF
MHDLSVATELYDSCRAEVAERGGGVIESVTVAVGELSAVEPDLLRLAWQALTDGGPDDGATLEVSWRPARQACLACGEIDQRQPGSWLRLCPGCGDPLQIEGGRDLHIMQICFQTTAPEEVLG